ncbi:hypothetical protein DFH09DRAFT_1397099, partial [Mycena vulgaris]
TRSRCRGDVTSLLRLTFKVSSLPQRIRAASNSLPPGRPNRPQTEPMAPYSITFPDPPTPPESLANLVASNDLPGPTESSLASAYIDELETHIALIDKATLALSRRRTDLLEALDAHKSISSSIRRLPPEILGEIFSWSVNAAYHFGDISEVSGVLVHNAPWVLTRVCRRWSAVALGNLALWSMLFLDLDRLGEQGAVSMTNLCLERSRDLPITVKIFHEG